MNTQPAATAASASRNPALSRVPARSVGSSADSWNIRDCGKLKPSGSRHAPCTSSDRISPAT